MWSLFLYVVCTVCMCMYVVCMWYFAKLITAHTFMYSHGTWTHWSLGIEYRSDDVTKKNFFWISVFWIPCIDGAWWKTSTAQIPNSYEPGQFTLISVGLIRYSCGHILGHHEPIHVKFGVGGFFIMFYWNIVMKMLKCKKENLMTSHFSTL